MDKYGETSVRAIELMHNNTFKSPIEAWDFATKEIFGEGTWAQKKSCPKNAFLGLCEEGLVKGIPQGLYNSRKNSKNKEYAVKAVTLIRKRPELIDNLLELWILSINGVEISHNYQMNVVQALWNKELIIK